jgi:hypothetical protein
MNEYQTMEIKKSTSQPLIKADDIDDDRPKPKKVGFEEAKEMADLLASKHTVSSMFKAKLDVDLEPPPVDKNRKTIK